MVFDERTIIDDGDREESLRGRRGKTGRRKARQKQSPLAERRGQTVHRIPNTPDSPASQRGVSRDVRALTANLVYGSVRRRQEAYSPDCSTTRYTRWHIFCLSRPSFAQLVHAAKLAPAPAPAPISVQRRPRWVLLPGSNTRSSRMSARGIERSREASSTTTVSGLADTRVAATGRPRAVQLPQSSALQESVGRRPNRQQTPDYSRAKTNIVS